ncbi:hypothetical protein AXF42_Ash001788 [Apostasia shenzhenica]|uniref:Uncharacterized protein n=1 Tax=Apostasia shenzhenica TaxID=1088818 RepID=A0A2I0AB76_9ASPA|nr:hypothetical protein AXF42_Ash001788 [Apostasia shenzhenica]
MATAAFRSSSRRSSIGGGGGPEDAGSSNRYRRSRSLSCYSGRYPPPPESEKFETPKGRFVNKVRGSGFPEISLDDLADEFFRSRSDEAEDEDISASVGRTTRRLLGERLLADTESSRRRGRSVVRHRGDNSAAVGNGVSGNRGNSRPRRSVSVSRSQGGEKAQIIGAHARRSMSNSRGSSAFGNLQKPSHHKQTIEGQLLGRSISQKEFFQPHDYCSSHSSSLTDDEAPDSRSCKSLNEKTIQAVHVHRKINHPSFDEEGIGLYEDMCKDVRNVVEELRTELEMAIGQADHVAKPKANSNQLKDSSDISAIAELRRSYSDKLEQSEKRKQDLLAKLALEEQRVEELSKIVKDLLPSSKPVAVSRRLLRSTQRSSDKLKISTRLTEEAERYFEDFLSNVEDTDLSSFDGERSDSGSSTRLKELINNDTAEVQANLLNNAGSPVETDGVLLPWLRWETSNDASPSPCRSMEQIKHASEILLQESDSFNMRSSLGSWSPEGSKCFCATSGQSSSCRLNVVESQMNYYSFDMDEYLQLQKGQDLLLAMWDQRQRIASGWKFF